MEPKRNVTLPDDLKETLALLPALAASVFIDAKIRKIKYDAVLEAGFSEAQALYLLKEER